MIVFFLTFLCFCVSSSVLIRDYNSVAFTEFETFAEMVRQKFNLNGLERSNSNIFVGVYEPDWADQLDIPAFKGVQRFAGGNTVESVSIPAHEWPFQLTSPVEIYYYPYDTLLQEPAGRMNEVYHTSLSQWTVDAIRIGVTFHNDFDFPIAVYYHNQYTEAEYKSSLAPGDAAVFRTSLGHVFSARVIVGDELRPDDPLADFMVVKGSEYHFSPLNRLKTCEVSSHRSVGFVDPMQYTCDNMEARLLEFSMDVWNEQRNGLNYVQPKLLHAASISPLGFELRKVPAATFAWLKAWYDKEKGAEEILEGSSGSCMNQLVAPSSITHLTPPLMDRLATELKPILQAWNGGGDIEMTSTYGIRKYTNGSILRMHVDTLITHVVSAIINVDQKVDEDWRLLILDHDDNEHWLTMKPGDMLMYESAKLLHGRPEPMIGEHYDNIFIHFKPLEGWNYDWL